ncbi:lipid-A-disaccharide synthase [Pontibacter sp. G13]|uniref:lipid-A-disaccharide synthase n=1 Tax=Pontibacter sp. G13 TaxID=3074898 RepID=UPI00288BD574|nr:lipid-A-disaccharide synthase [Pontibacter sp. G13]WNJ21382.1 lipid-A-disaccharide synthase [Pontibacter sp. G13]
MNLYILAGEDSGDLHGSNLVKALLGKRPDIHFYGVGGDKMSDAGVALSAHVRDINFMGFWEIVRNLRTIRKLFKTVKSDIERIKPDGVILIDYPGFNLRLAKYLHQRGIPVYYYISPQVWAWKKGRVKQIRQFVDRMMVILPFEESFYANEGVEVDFVGHPLLDVIPKTNPADRDQRILALLPGSRKQEISRMLPVMLSVQDRFPEYQFVIAGAPSQQESFYQQFIGDRNVELWMNKTYELLQHADAAMVTSGTATLETALFHVPEVVCYKGSRLSYEIGRRLVNIKFISLVNLILDKEVVKELIQYDFNTETLGEAVTEILDPIKRSEIIADYDLLWDTLGNEGASARAAQVILDQMSQKAVVA